MLGWYEQWQTPLNELDGLPSAQTGRRPRPVIGERDLLLSASLQQE